MATVALSKDLWVSYDATNCGLYKAWTGGVKFDGSVYTTVHGPQPTSEGRPYLLGEVQQPVWKLMKGNETLPDKPKFRGYSFVSNQVRFQYEFPMKGAPSIWVYETPEFIGGGTQPPGLSRTFEVKDVPKGMSVVAQVVVPDIPGQPADKEWRTDGNLILGGPGDQDAAQRSGLLVLKSSGKTELDCWFLQKPQPGESPSHGPSVWSPISYSYQTEQKLDQNQREPGLSLRVYQIGKEISKIPTMLMGQTPNYSVVIPTVNLKTDQDFGGLSDNFYAKISGFLNVTVAGTYQFRLSSDDGSRLFIRDEKIIDNDGPHGDTAVEGSFPLTPGEHPILIEYYEGGGDNVLRLEWKKPGDASWSIIPATAFSTQKGEVRVTSPGNKAVVDPANRMRPGCGKPLEAVHPSYDLATIRPKDFHPRVGGMDFLPDGRLVICTWDPDGAVYVLEGVQDPIPHNIKVKRIAAGLAEPLGLKVVDGTIYVLQKQELTKLIDHNGDEIIDEYYAVANGWGVTANFHEFSFGLVFKDGFFYGNLSTAINPGGKSTQPQNHDRGRTIKIAKDGSSYELVTKGLRTPNGIGIGYKGKIFITDNQGDWLPSSKLLEYKPGAFYGSQSVDPINSPKWPVTPPVVWLPQGEIGNSPSQPSFLNDGPYKDQMIHGDVTHGGVKRVFIEEVNGVLQGAAFRFTQGLEAGINRLVWGPDHALYVGGIGSTGNWGQEGKEWFGLQRLKYNGKPSFEPLAVRAFKNGMEIELTQPLMDGMGMSPDDYFAEHWRYVPTDQYGGPKVDERTLKVKSVTVAKDRKHVFLELDGLKPGTVVYLRMNQGLADNKDRELWTSEAWYTLNEVPAKVHAVAPVVQPINALTAEEQRQGFKLLFDGKTLQGWKGWRTDAPAKAWSVKDGTLAVTPGTGSDADIATIESFGNFELRIEWMVAPGSNSGVFYRSTEDHNVPWETGFEMQVLDDELNPDGRSKLTSAGSVYALYPPIRDVTRPAGKWNETRVIAKGNHIEHWLNGYKVAQFEIGSSDYVERYKKSKYAGMADFGKKPSGKIALQDHGYPVAFRNIRIRKL